MKNKNNLLWLFMVAMMLGGCSCRNTDKHNDNNNVNDTVFVVGVLDQPAAYGNKPKKYLYGVNKKNERYYMQFRLNDGFTVKNKNRDALISFIERGDTIILEQGRIVRDLTMEHMINHYVNGR